MLNRTPPFTTNSINVQASLYSHSSASTILPLMRGIEDKIIRSAIEQDNSAITPSWRPGLSSTFIPQTDLGKKLWDIKKKLIASGQTTNNWDLITEEINSARDLNK